MALGASGGNTIAMIARNVIAVAIGGVIGLIAATLLAPEGILGVEPTSRHSRWRLSHC